jgi:hypothetical protein
VRTSFKIGVDGGGTKTECILVDHAGVIIARHLAPGCNPSVIGPEQARLVVVNALRALCEQAEIRDSRSTISTTHIYAAGNRTFWRETAGTLTAFGEVFTADDSYPVLELATHGAPPGAAWRHRSFVLRAHLTAPSTMRAELDGDLATAAAATILAGARSRADYLNCKAGPQ